LCDSAQFRLTGELLESSGIDLIICDEAHRLKNVQIKTSQVLKLTI
jgi:SNF2 family DNA or RNA helicase